MKVELKDGNLILTIPTNEPRPSASGKTLVIASTNGNQTTQATVNGKPVIVGFNAYIRR
jgi:phosphosulfolactate phosphohydrolase-like enzyme